jgi:hypothetical protein
MALRAYLASTKTAGIDQMGSDLKCGGADKSSRQVFLRARFYPLWLTPKSSRLVFCASGES